MLVDLIQKALLLRNQAFLFLFYFAGKTARAATFFLNVIFYFKLALDNSDIQTLIRFFRLPPTLANLDDDRTVSFQGQLTVVTENLYQVSWLLFIATNIHFGSNLCKTEFP